MKTRLIIVLASLAMVGTVALAHGNHPGEANSAGRPGDPGKVVRTVQIVASEIKYDVKHLSFRVGDTVKFVLVNKGEQDHELTIGDSAYQLHHRKEMAEVAATPSGTTGGMGSHHHHDGTAISAKPGETKELVWQFTTAGSFEFDCNIPGHAEAGMAGTITVR